MAPLTCPKCGHPGADAATACARCGHDMKNGTVPQAESPAGEKAVPAEVSGWIVYQTPAELVEWARQTCSEEEAVAAWREVERTGGLELKDFLHELEEG